jgi:hypothetical protein
MGRRTSPALFLFYEALERGNVPFATASIAVVPTVTELALARRIVAQVDDGPLAAACDRAIVARAAALARPEALAPAPPEEPPRARVVRFLLSEASEAEEEKEEPTRRAALRVKRV